MPHHDEEIFNADPVTEVNPNPVPAANWRDAYCREPIPDEDTCFNSSEIGTFFKKQVDNHCGMHTVNNLLGQNH